MQRKIRFSAIAVVFGSCADRYVLEGYSPKKSFEEMMRAAKGVPDLEGIELVGGWHLTSKNAREVVKKVEDFWPLCISHYSRALVIGKVGSGEFCCQR